AQDVGDAVQSAPGSMFWDSLIQGDGGTVQTIPRTGPDDLIYSKPNLAGFRIQTGILTGNPMLTFANTSPPTITRAAGDWVADGFQVGQQARVTNSSGNNRFFTITGFSTVHTANDTLRLSTNDILIPEGPHSGV